MISSGADVLCNKGGGDHDVQGPSLRPLRCSQGNHQDLTALTRVFDEALVEHPAFIAQRQPLESASNEDRCGHTGPGMSSEGLVRQVAQTGHSSGLQ